MQHSIIFFDGVCNLCTASVKFVINRDQKDLYRFAPLQGSVAAHYLGAGAAVNQDPGSIVLLEGGKLYKRSAAALRIARHLGGLWPLLSLFLIVPPVIRDFLYDLVASNRYRIWGKAESCLVPTPQLRAKFL